MTREPDMPEEAGEPQPVGAESAATEPAGAEPTGPEPTGPEPPPPPKALPGKSVMREWLETIIVALLVALAIRAFVVQVYLVDGESMEPTLHTAERLLVNKFIYRIHPPEPGDIVVLQDPSRSTRELIKRVVAVAGETVEVKRGVLYVNGKAIQEPFKNTDFAIGPEQAPLVIPPGNIFVMGDNRARSFDSRMIGVIPLKNVDGKAFFLFWPMRRFAAGPLTYPRQYEQAAVTK